MKSMPLVKVEMLKGKNAQYKETVLNCIHKALVDSIGIEDWDRFQRVIEYDRNDFEFPSFKTEDFMIIELTIFPGRTKEQKAAAIEAITDSLNRALSIAPSDVFILINEPPLENWGMGGKQKE
jgi:4-oxalocrotonate tautomerase family enzyme